MSISLQIRRSRRIQHKLVAWLIYKKQDQSEKRLEKILSTISSTLVRFHTFINNITLQTARVTESIKQLKKERVNEWEREDTFICYYIPFVEGACQIFIISLMICSNNGGDDRVDIYILYVKKWVAYFVNVLNHNENKVKTLFFFKLETLYIYIYQISSYLYKWKKKESV